MFSATHRVSSKPKAFARIASVSQQIVLKFEDLFINLSGIFRQQTMFIHTIEKNVRSIAEMKEKFQVLGVIRYRKLKDRQYNPKRKKTKEQAMTYTEK